MTEKFGEYKLHENNVKQKHSTFIYLYLRKLNTSVAWQNFQSKGNFSEFEKK